MVFFIWSSPLTQSRAWNCNIIQKNVMWRRPCAAKDLIWGGSLSWWVTTARTSVHSSLPTTRVTFISNRRNIALIPILSVGARCSSLWSLNNFTGLRFPPCCICISLLPCLLSSQLGHLPGCNLFVMAYPYCQLGTIHTLCQKAITHKCLVTRTTIMKLKKLVSDYI